MSYDECYDTFYHPSNMLLFVVGPNEKAIIDMIRKDQAARPFKDQPEIQRRFDDEPENVRENGKILKMNVQTPKCMVGMKGNFINQQGDEMLKRVSCS